MAKSYKEFPPIASSMQRTPSIGSLYKGHLSTFSKTTPAFASSC